MKVNKTQAVLFMYALLMRNHYFTKEYVMGELEISELTFLRYIQELRAYLFNFENSNEIVYKRSEDKYLLKNL